MPHSMDSILRARGDYAEGKKTVAAICEEHALELATLYRWLDGDIGPGEQKLEPLPRRRVTTAPRTSRRPISRVALVRRMWCAAEAQVRDIEQRLTGERPEPEDRERDARLLAVLVKTLRELTALDAAEGDRKQATDVTPDDLDAPRDLDEFRRELARRMDAFVASRSGAGVPGGAADR